jgi:hypothetical protein
MIRYITCMIKMVMMMIGIKMIKMMNIKYD